MRFLGGNNLIFTLIVFILIGITFLLYGQLEFIIEPLFVIFSAILTPLIISVILYYLLEPIIAFFEKKGVPRLAAIIGLYILVIATIGLLGVWLVPVLQQQFLDLVAALPGLFNQVQSFVTNMAENFITTDNQRDAFQQGLDFFSNLETNFINYLSEGFTSIGNLISSITNAMLIIFIVPVILFFLLKDGSMYKHSFMERVPPAGRKDIASILAAIDAQVGNYIKGQIIIAMINGIMMFIGFTIIDLNYSGVLAVTGGVFSFIPYLGPTLTFVPAVVIALGDSLFMVLKLIIVWIVIQFVEGNLIEPNVMGNRLNIHPITIIFVLLVMGELLGVVGMLIGVPLYAVIRVFVTFAYQKYQKRYNKYYGNENGSYDVATMNEVYEIAEQTDESNK